MCVCACVYQSVSALMAEPFDVDTRCQNYYTRHISDVGCKEGTTREGASTFWRFHSEMESYSISIRVRIIDRVELFSLADIIKCETDILL